MKTKVGRFARSVSIIGVGSTPFGNVLEDPEIKNLTERELFAWAAIDAMKDAGIEAKDIDSFYVGSVFSESHASQISTSGMLGRWAGLLEKPGFKHETACTTAISGLRHAACAVASGMQDIVLTCNVDINQSVVKRGYPPHLRELYGFDDLIFDCNALGCDNAYWYPGGEIIMFLEGAYIAYGKKYGYSLKQLKEAMHKIAIMSRRNAVSNPLALASKETYEEEAKKLGFDDVMEYLDSKYNPLVGVVQTLKHTCLINDGASAVIVCPTELAKKLSPHPVEIIGFGMSTSPGYLQAGSPMSFEKEAFGQAFEMAGIKDPYKEIDCISIHDCCAQHYITTTETAGYFKPGEGLSAAFEGRMAPNGDKPVNTSGGRLNMGHPISGAQGEEILEAVYQMRGICGERQMKKRPETAVIHGYGAGFHSAVLVLRAL